MACRILGVGDFGGKLGKNEEVAGGLRQRARLI